MARKKKQPIFTLEQKQAADAQIKESQKQIDYDTKDFTIELLISKFNKGDFFIPSYQRRFVWKEKNKNLFLESIFLGLPIPFMFLADCSDGRQEIIDGAQRMQTIVEFYNNKLAYLNEYEKFGHDVNEFLNDYLIRNLVTFDQEKFQLEFDRMVQFVQKTFPFGFAKTENAKSTPRVRFEALAVGVALALREKPDLSVTNIDWLNSDKFKEYTTSDASNNEGKLKLRVEYVRDQLLKGE